MAFALRMLGEVAAARRALRAARSVASNAILRLKCRDSDAPIRKVHAPVQCTRRAHTIHLSHPAPDAHTHARRKSSECRRPMDRAAIAAPEALWHAASTSGAPLRPSSDWSPSTKY
jgi:hypothetical protein